MSNRSEASLDRACARWIREAGGWWLKLHPSTLRGVPDRLAVLPNGQFLLVELKTPTGRLSPLQQARHEALRAMGHRVAVVRKLLDLKPLVYEALDKRPLYR